MPSGSLQTLQTWDPCDTAPPQTHTHTHRIIPRVGGKLETLSSTVSNKLSGSGAGYVSLYWLVFGTLHARGPGFNHRRNENNHY